MSKHTTEQERPRRCLGFRETDGKCANPAGTPWSPYWCSECDARRREDPFGCPSRTPELREALKGEGEQMLHVYSVEEIGEVVIAASPEDALRVVAETRGDTVEEVCRDGRTGKTRTAQEMGVRQWPDDKRLTLCLEDEPEPEVVAFVVRNGRIDEGTDSWDLSMPCSAWVELEGRSHLASEDW